MARGSSWLGWGAALAAVPALCPAQTAYYQGSPDRLNLTLEVRASVSPRCGFLPASAPSGNYVENDFDRTGFDRAATFKLDCTTASRVGVVSSNGGLANPAAGPGPGYATLAPYDVQLTLNGNTESASATCAAADLTGVASGCMPTYLPAVGPNFAGPASSVQGLRLSSPATTGSDSVIRLKANRYAGANVLVAGTYSDTLTVTVSPAT